MECRNINIPSFNLARACPTRLDKHAVFIELSTHLHTGRRISAYKRLHFPQQPVSIKYQSTTYYY